MKYYRTWVLLLTLWFALLQTIAPLMHAHAAGDTAADDGPHMHMVDIPALHVDTAETSKHPFHWHVHSNKSHGQIIGLGQAISESNTWSSLIDAYANVWLTALLSIEQEPQKSETNGTDLFRPISSFIIFAISFDILLLPPRYLIFLFLRFHRVLS